MGKETYRVETEDGSVYEIETEDTQPQQAATASGKHDGLVDSAMTSLGSWWDKVNPVAQIQGLSEAVNHPVAAGKAMLDAQGQLAMQAKESFEKGDYAKGLRQSLHYLIPVLGPEMEAASRKFEEGKTAEGVGETLGIGTNIVAPAAIAKIRGVPVLPKLQNLNPAEQAAIEFAQQRGIPVSAGAATGNKFVKGAQLLTGATPGGAVVGGIMERSSARNLQRVAGELAQEAHPQVTVPESAGASVRGALETKAANAKAQAKAGYALRDAAEADPKNLRTVQQGINPQGEPVFEKVPLPVDMAPLKKQVAPIFKQMSEDPYWTVTRREASSGYKAVETIVNGPDYVPPSQAEGLLSAMKTLAREGEGRSQGIGKYIVPNLEAAVDTAVGQGAPQALTGLKAGRKLTAASYATREVLDQLHAEPVKAFRQLAQRQDAGIGQLRGIAAEVPGELPKLGRAWLEDLFEKATAEGGFGRNQKLSGEWNNLGAKTKELMFPNPMLRGDLDKLFLAQKKITENVNPSGSATFGLGSGYAIKELTDLPTLLKTTIGSAAFMGLLYSPRGVQLLTQGLKIPLGNRAAVSAAVAELAKIAGDDKTKQKATVSP